MDLLGLSSVVNLDDAAFILVDHGLIQIPDANLSE